MTSKSNNIINDALSVATAVAYTKKEVDKLNQRIDSLAEEKQKDIVEYVQGPAGEQGPRGADGATGERGEKGDKGDKGDRGDRGPEGLPGLAIKGDKGDKGERGEQGPAGADGRDGINGKDGKDGADGKDGINGVDGKDGRDGIDGQNGKDGRDGIDGRNGIDGKDGKDGVDGKQGPKGDKGEPGERGEQGPKGDKGEDGATPDIKPLEDKFKKFQDVIEKDLQQYKNKINASVSKAMATDAWKATGSGEVNLRYLDDVDRDSITDGYVLSYDEATQKFTFVSPTAGSFTPTDVTQVFAEVKNAENFTITKGQAVYLHAATGNKASVKLANNTGDATSAKTLGLVYSASITAGGTGLIITQGVLTGVNTQAYNEGDTLYLANTAGQLTSTKPYAPQHLVYIGVVERANQGQGQIYVRPQNGYELNEIHDVNIDHNVALSNADILVYNSSNSLWENRPVSYLGLSTSDSLARTTANSAYTQANTATTLAQAAYDAANSATGSLDTLARSIANSAFAQANTATTNAATADTKATNAYNQANTATSLAQAAYNYANTIVSDTQIDPFARSQANSAFNQANTATTNASNAYSAANSASTLAQAAYNQANTPQAQLVNGSDTLSLNGSNKVELPGGTSYIFSTTNNITLAPDNSGNNYLEIINNVGTTISTDRGFDIRTNADGTNRVWSFTQGGSLFFPDSTYQTTAFTGTAIDSTARTTANSAYSQANTATTNAATANNQAASAYSQANTATTNAATADTKAGNAYNQANTATTNASTADTKAGNAWSTANSAYTQANTATTNAASANTKAQAAYDASNTAYSTAMNAYSSAGIAITEAEEAWSKANSAFDKANTAITTSGGTSTGTITSNNATAFIAGTAAESGVALQMPREGALRNLTNGQNTMYFDVSNGGSTHGSFRFRSSSGFTELLDISTDGLRAISAYKGKTPFNSAIDTVVTVDNIKYRVSNQGGIFPQIASASGSTVDVCYDVEGVVNGTTNPTYANNSGYILLANGTWLSIYSSHGMDARGDRLTAHITDKAAGKIYRATFMRTNNSSNIDGYNIIVERIL